MSCRSSRQTSRCGDDVTRAAAAVIGGDAIVYPTETIYGIGVDARSDAAIQRLIALKGRDAAKGISVLVAGSDDIDTLIDGPPPPAALRLMEAFWPGPLTIVLPAAKAVSPALVGPSGGIGLRCAADPWATRLVASCRTPLTSTSANPSGEVPAATVEQARAYFDDRVAYYLDGGERRAGLASSVVEFATGGIFLRRAGAIPATDLEALVEFSDVPAA